MVAGYRAGFDAGWSDARQHRSFAVHRHHSYRGAATGHRDGYGRAFRSGFEAGYERAYRDAFRQGYDARGRSR
jgi:hypothetical protein